MLQGKGSSDSLLLLSSKVFGISVEMNQGVLMFTKIIQANYIRLFLRKAVLWLKLSRTQPGQLINKTQRSFQSFYCLRNLYGYDCLKCILKLLLGYALFYKRPNRITVQNVKLQISRLTVSPIFIQTDPPNLITQLFAQRYLRIINLKYSLSLL